MIRLRRAKGRSAVWYADRLAGFCFRYYGGDWDRMTAAPDSELLLLPRMGPKTLEKLRRIQK